MKILRQLILLVVLLVINTFGARAGQITHNVNFDPSKLTIRYDTVDNEIFAMIYYDKMVSVNSNGHPVLPSDVLLFSVPYNADSFDVHCNVVSYNEFQLNADVYPGPQIIETNDSYYFVYNQKDTTIYGMNSFYPDSLFRALGSGFMNGGNRILKTHLYPLLYNPTTRKLRLATSIQLVVNYDENLSIIPNVARKNNEIKEKEILLTESYVQNVEDVTINAFEPKETLGAPSNGGDGIIPTYNYCIITSRELEPAFKKIIAMKRQKGLSAGTVCIEDLIASPFFNKGDYNHNSINNDTHIITDSAGIVRNYLKYAFMESNNPTSFVLMGGKKEHAPVRFFNVSYGVSTDTYYSDLTQIWDENGNILIGYGNQIDRPITFWPDLFVGRLLCNNRQEIDSYSDKLYQYAFNPGNGNKSYLKRALFFCSPEYDLDCENVLYSSSDFFDSANLMENWYYGIFTGADLIDEINSTRYGYISGYCNGEPQAMGICFSDYLLTALDEYVPANPSTANESGNGLDNLTNKMFPAIFYSLASSSIVFDNSTQVNSMTQFANKYNLGESYTVGGKYGGIAFLGNTKNGYTEFSFPLEINFFRSMRTHHVYNLGVSEGMSKVYYAPDYGFSLSYNGYFNEIMTSHNLIGDPEVEMWTNEPMQYNQILVAHLENGFSITGVSCTDTIAYCDNYGRQGLLAGCDNNPIFVPAHPTSTLMIYNHEHIPYIEPMLLQNCEIQNSQYVYASSFGAGKNVLPGIVNGNVTIKNGAVYEVDATDDVLLSEGFIVEDGANFNVKTPGKVTIDGCVFQGGAKVKIEAGNVEFVGKFTAERGAKVEFTQYVDE